MSNTFPPDHIADANKKVQPAPAPRTPEGSNANGSDGISGGNPRTPAPLPGEVEDAIKELRTLAATDPGDGLSAVICGDIISAHISDLTRRLAEAEECLTIAYMDGYHKGQKAGQSEHNNSVRMGQYILEAKTEKLRAESAEARVAELDAHYLAACKQRALAEARVAELEAQLSGVGVRQYREAVERLHKAEARVRELEAESMTFRTECINLETQRADLEAFKARAMEWARGRCGACGHEGSEGDTCYDCNSDDERSNWTPPQAWEVGE